MAHLSPIKASDIALACPLSLALASVPRPLPQHASSHASHFCCFWFFSVPCMASASGAPLRESVHTLHFKALSALCSLIAAQLISVTSSAVLRILIFLLQTKPFFVTSGPSRRPRLLLGLWLSGVPSFRGLACSSPRGLAWVDRPSPYLTERRFSRVPRVAGARLIQTHWFVSSFSFLPSHFYSPFPSQSGSELVSLRGKTSA